MALVWYSSWQMECCGEPFAVNDTVVWNLTTDADDDWLINVFGDELASEVAHHEDHHDIEDGARRHHGRVLSIRCAYCQFAPTPGEDERHLYPVSGSAKIVHATRVDGLEQRKSELSFIGYLIDLELAERD